MSYRLKEGQIIGPDDCVAAEVYGLGTEAGRRRAKVILAALNAPERRVDELRAIRCSAQDLAESGRAVEDDFRALAHLVARLVTEVSR